MASCIAVNVQCPNGRRQKVKLNAHMTLLQVIQEVCKKQDLDPTLYSLKHQRRTLDSDLTIHFANLPNNAHLELVESTEKQTQSVKKCVVALQLENGERLVHEFSCAISLFDILMHWKAQSESLMFDDTLADVACIYANQKISGLEKLQTTTLSMIGLNGGRGVIRLIQPTPMIPDTTHVESTEEETTIDKPENHMSGSSLTPEKPSTEEMEIASCSASSVSMASQVSEDAMQCTETPEEPTINLDKLDEGKPIEASQSEAGDSKSKKKGGKKQDAMEIEHCEVRTGVGKEGSSAPVELDSKRQVDVHPPPVESVASTSSGSRARSAAQVEAFSGEGRTLSDAGPNLKKARLYSPPSSSNKTSDDSKELRNLQRSQDDKSVCQPEREALAFQLGDITAVPSDDVSDDFFEVTVNDLRLMLKDLKNDRTVAEPLMTTKMREERVKNKMEQYDRVAIRVYFPDQTVLQGFFSPTETVSALTSFVNENLQQRDTNFYLYTTPPKKVLDKPSLTLFEAKLFPTAVVHFGSREIQGCYLHSRLLEEMGDVTSANARVDKYHRRLSSSSSTHGVETDTTSASGSSVQTENCQSHNETLSTSGEQSNESPGIPRPHVSKSAPKWFKFGK